MNNKIVISVSSKILTIPDCVKLVPNKIYSDVITKGFEYNNISQFQIAVINNCSEPFNVDGKNLFTDTVNGGNFVAKINNFSIGAGQTMNIPVIYNGIYLGDNQNPNYQISMSEITGMVKLSVVIPIINNPPVTSDINIILDNRGTHMFTLNDFLSHFTDLDGDTLDSVFIEGNVTGYFYNNQPYISGTEISKSDIQSERLKYIAPDTDIETNSTTIWKAKDSRGAISTT